MDTKKIIIAAASVAIIGGGAYTLTNAEKNETKEEGNSAPVAQNTPAATTQDAAATATVSGSKYKDGTWSADGHYNSPGGEQKVHIDITLADGKITGATFVGTPASPADKFNQQKFAEGFKQEVVGKPIDSVKLDVVNGSSLTPKGFMEALEAIKKEAHA